MFNAIKFLQSRISGRPLFDKCCCKLFVEKVLNEKASDLVISDRSQKLGHSFYLNEQKNDFIEFGSNNVLIVYDYKYESFGKSCVSGLLTYENGDVSEDGAFNPHVRSVLSDKQINVYNQTSLQYLANPNFQTFVSPDASRELTDDDVDSFPLVVEVMISEAQELVNSKRKVK